MKKILPFIGLCAFAHFSQAKDIEVKQVRYVGGFKIEVPIMIDSTDVLNNKFDSVAMLDAPLNLSLVKDAPITSCYNMPQTKDSMALHLAQFNITNTQYTTAKLKFESTNLYRVFIDNKPIYDNKLELAPQTHSIVVKYLTLEKPVDSLKIYVESKDSTIDINNDTKRTLTLPDLQNGTRCYNVSLSANGRFLITTYYTIVEGGNSKYYWKLTDLKTGKVLRDGGEELKWLPNQNRYYTFKNGSEGRMLVATDPLTGQEETIIKNLPEGNITLSPDLSFCILSTSQEAKDKDKDVYEIASVDDKQPGWKTRWNLSIFDCKTGLTRPLTFGYHNVSLQDISQDGKKILFSTSQQRLEKRPTTLFSFYVLNLETNQTMCIINKDGFVSSAKFSPDATKILAKGSPEAFEGIGKNLPNNRIPNMYDYQLYCLDINTKKVVPLTKYFNPSIENFYWNATDNNVYVTALDKDEEGLYRINPTTAKHKRIALPETSVFKVNFAQQSPLLAFYGESASNSDRLYTMSLTNEKPKLIEDFSNAKLKDITLGSCTNWNFKTSRGDTIYGKCYLPPHFDATKKYPMIVYYYGGCSPVGSYFESYYSYHLFAAQGYVVYMLNPSGAAGFGQEHASRHVNTAGKGVAEDIIEGTKAFIASHPYVDSKRVGCLGASYGGFMTQYLQTQTNLFAAAISHAGISNHTSYWGEGYWGYSYSEVSMAGSYPWTRKDLYVDQSPVFNAEKIHTPLLFLHGTDDTNVPIGESYQMFTALKLLKRPTAFVVVEGENHHITNYHKRRKWQNTIFAWFERYLKNNNTWWNALYPEKNLE